MLIWPIIPCDVFLTGRLGACLVYILPFHFEAILFDLGIFWSSKEIKKLSLHLHLVFLDIGISGAEDKLEDGLV